MGSQPRRLAILSLVVSMLAIGLECAIAEECDYKTCGALMARDASASWAVSGRHDYSPDTKRACAEFNACLRRAKNNSAGRAAAVPSNAQGPATQSRVPVTVGNSPATIGSDLRASCGPDVQKLCTGARRESEVLKCLDSQRMELSTTCSLYFPKMGARPAALGNASSKKPSSLPLTAPIPVQRKRPPSPPPIMPTPAPDTAPNEKRQSPPITPTPAQDATPNEKTSPSLITPTPAQDAAPNEKTSPSPITPTPAQENAPNKRVLPPPAISIPD
jgi:hypothetical protein